MKNKFKIRKIFIIAFTTMVILFLADIYVFQNNMSKLEKDIELMQVRINSIRNNLYKMAEARAAKERRLALPATNITNDVNVTITSQEDSELLLDDNIKTKYHFGSEDVINIKSSEKIYSVYIIWDQVPESFSTESNNQITIYDKDNYLHQYLIFDDEPTDIKIKLSDDESVITDIYVFTMGTPPEWVQIWQPPYRKADILLLPTHGDDEYLWFGGTIPYYAGELQKKVQVAYLNNHDNQNYRHHEILNALWKGGNTTYPVFSKFPDRYAETLLAAKKVYNYEDWVEYQTELLRRFKPEVVIAHDINGEYGHGGHQLNTNSLLAALEVSMNAEIYKELADKYGIWDVPKTYIHLYEKNKIKMDWHQPLSFADGKTALDVARAGYLEHQSQQYTWFQVNDSGRYDCSSFGLYRTTVGPDIKKNDFLENIK